MSPFDPDLAGTSDYLHTAVNLEKLVTGDGRNGWFAHVRGYDADDGAAIGVAWYRPDHLTKPEATRRAGQLLRHVRDLRLSAL